MTIQDLEPGLLWKYFYEITQIPRPSKKEGKIIAYLLDFAQQNNLEVKNDDAGNILIVKPATRGYEEAPTVILQGHVDMVCEKNSDTEFDFDTDPIQTYVDGDWLKARGTTLGADNGIGVAAALAILASDNIEHGKLECLFTVDEETGLSGAYALGEDFLSGDILINLDTEEEGELYIGCAGGKGTTASFQYYEWSVPENYYWFNIQVKGLNGGHSGSEIHKGLGNANKILARFLQQLSRKIEIRLASINGGNLHNAIAREASAILGTPIRNKDKMVEILNIFIAEIEDELRVVDPNIIIQAETVSEPPFTIEEEVAIKLVTALCACPHGVLAMSQDIPGLVEASTNLASIKMKENNLIVIGTSQRSSTYSLKNYAASMVNSVFTLAGAIVLHSAGYPGWKPNPDSKILEVAKYSFKKLYNKSPKVKAIHAGLECGLFLEKYPHLDMISCGPTITDAHSPAEQANIPSVDKWWKFLLEMLKNIQNANLEIKASIEAAPAPKTLTVKEMEIEDKAIEIAGSDSPNIEEDENIDCSAVASEVDVTTEAEDEVQPKQVAEETRQEPSVSDTSRRRSDRQYI